MLKRFLVSCLCLGMISIPYASSSLPFERLVIFGDSLSDTGNFPEPNDYSSSDTPPYNLYIPIANPVNSQLYGTQFQIPESQAHWNYPSEQFLATASSPQGLINGQAKTYRSINWPEYFIYNAFLTKNTANSKLTSWYSLYKASTAPDASTSLNYAWAGALTINGFTNQDYTPFQMMDEQELYDLKQSYLNNKISIGKIAIPGLNQQINIYLNDLNNKKVEKNDSTAYLIYIGGNDIAETLSNDLLSFKLKTFFSKVGSVSFPGTIAMNVKAAVDSLIQNANAKRIYILTYLNVANLPTAYNQSSSPLIRWPLKKLISSIVSTYNKQLISLFNTATYQSIINVLPVGQTIDKVAQTPQFSHSVQNGLSCVNQVATATNPQPNINNCNYNNSQTYFAWNNSHLTTIVNQYVAYQVYYNMINSIHLKTIQSDAKEQEAIKKSITSVLSLS
ncbi:Autotransporter protein or domain, integral membrane beta-barrel involved in protein secretion [Piscirickettsia salmonis]|nr:Autotransporter protein or domain, integral membrane beta-barrel involved in protein secretion [Piscirickettsia salmonis]QGP61250.1 Autotransporter protein or domain, integral membrane beta-barrel involved in protein secretion [Piscirickettsia salmonis]QGP62395.1 Autotransporter protein or domain, integral membrane beta-barrel involved in protein secretion [Piscirickettsia salmonis]